MIRLLVDPLLDNTSAGDKFKHKLCNPDGQFGKSSLKIALKKNNK